jgi:putative restriction endonuclease
VRIPLIGQTGIRKPRGFEAALTIMTAYRRDPFARPYYDELGPDGYQRYKWRGEDPLQADNRALRSAMEERKPLLWFYGIAPATYVPVVDVLLLAEEPEQRQFVLGFTPLMREQWDLASVVQLSPPDLALRREYAIAATRQRLHQPVFRQQVIRAYHSECAICSLRRLELLEAAHIREDAAGGEPVVSNGVSMCVLHHRAFDRDVIGIRPDLVVETRASVLGEIDGPTLTHALQGVHGKAMRAPTRAEHRPNKEYLEERYERFRAAS